MVGGWHYLCVGVLHQAVNRLASETNVWSKQRVESRIKTGGGGDKEVLRQRGTAREWIEGGVGLVTFEDCCEAMGVEPARAREKILEHCGRRKREKPDPEWGG